MTALFYGAAAVTLLMAILVVTRRSYMHALVFLVLLFLGVGTMVFALGSPFAAALEVIVYAGAIMVLFIFSIMLLNLGPAQDQRERQWLGGLVWALPVLLVATLLGVAFHAMVHPSVASEPTAGAVIPAAAVGRLLFTDYLPGVEIASLMLLAALIAAFHFGFRPHERDAGPGTEKADGPRRHR